MARKRKSIGMVMLEAALVIVPYMMVTIGSIEYLWFMNMKMSLAAAAEKAVRVVAHDHNELLAPGGGVSSQSLEPYQGLANQEATGLLLSMGYSQSLVDDVTVRVDFIQGIASSNQRYINRGIPQKEGRRLVGAEVSIPYEHAMIFGNIVVSLLAQAVDLPENFTSVAFMWKQWKQEN